MHDVEALVTRVVDGDTFVCTVYGHILDLEFDLPNQYIRIIGIDTPELEKETYLAGMKAKERLEDLILNKKVRLHSEGKRSFHRILAKVYMEDERNVADVLIKEGLGVPYEG